MMNLRINENSNLVLGLNKQGEKVVNGNTFQMLHHKRTKMNYTFDSIPEKDDLYIYTTLNPMILEKNQKMKFKINKNDLNQFFLESNEKRNEKEIYNSELFKLINPYYLVEETDYLNKKYLSSEILNSLNEEKETLKERNTNMFSNQYYDKKRKIFFGIPRKEHKFNKIKKDELIKDSIKDKCLVVRLKNTEDGKFNKILLLKPDFTFDELKILIKLIYKAKYGIKNINEINLYYRDIFYNEAKVENFRTLSELSRKINTKYELTIYIEAHY